MKKSSHLKNGNQINTTDNTRIVLSLRLNDSLDFQTKESDSLLN